MRSRVSGSEGIVVSVLLVLLHFQRFTHECFDG